MFVCNLKFNKMKSFKILFIILVIIIIIILCVAMYRIFTGAGESFIVSDDTDEDQIIQIEPKNYTNILKSVHENIDEYVGKKIKFTGYVYRISDLKDNQFILARNMIVTSDFQFLVVGFLCEADNAKDFQNYMWVDVTGEITKGDYHGDMPIIKVTKMNYTNKPAEENVYPPDESYIPTSCTF